jgi:hypothetical protein
LAGCYHYTSSGGRKEGRKESQGEESELAEEEVLAMGSEGSAGVVVGE